MGRSKTYKLDLSSFNAMIANGTQKIGGETITAAFVPYPTPVVFCGKCGSGIAFKGVKATIEVDSIVCPTCKTAFSNHKTVTCNTWHTVDLHKIHSDQNGIYRAETKWKPEFITGVTASEQILKFTLQERTQESYSYRDSLYELPSDMIRVLYDKHPEYFPDGAKELMSVSLNHSAKEYWAFRLSTVKDIAMRAPHLLEIILQSFSGSGWNLDEIVNHYPEYLLPLTHELIRSYNPYNNHNSYNRKTWLPISKFNNIENVYLVVNYYKSNLISFDQMHSILQHPSALNNPKFAKTFKGYYTQMASYLTKLEEEKQNLQFNNFDIRSFYMDKTMDYIVSKCQYSEEQFFTAFSETTNYLDSIIQLGSMRRSSK